MGRKDSKAEEISAQEIVEKFILRARRVELHSLVKSGEVNRLANPVFNVTISTNDSVTIQHPVCKNEEALESLASRLRPFMLETESIYLKKVFEAILCLVPLEKFAENETENFNAIRKWFESRCENKNSGRYGIQVINAENKPITDMLWENLIGESYLYIDAVHSDPRGKKQEALKLDFYARYGAASSFFSELACMIVNLLNLVRRFNDKGELNIPVEIFNTEVAFDSEHDYVEKVLTGSLYALSGKLENYNNICCEDIPGSQKMTFVSALGLFDPKRAVDVIILDSEGSQIEIYCGYFEKNEESFTLYIDEIGKVILSKVNDIGSENSMKNEMDVRFEAFPSKEKKMKTFISLASFPNKIKIRFAFDNSNIMFSLKKDF
ncbi:hypothetical protein [Lancefieldella parvula]|uniref:hypothetical protein n=1 Tax=Lancefieldella parvula TaxID=1382 RepID=UPI00290EB580|nr:hypothetical protein [Lancefieldella parvula]MDU4868661.1 hypothetical protein [Lancefieldella parvula]